MIIYSHSDCLLKFNGSGHPETKERLTFDSELPNNFKELLDKWKIYLANRND